MLPLEVAASPTLIVTEENNNQGVTPNQLKALRKEASKRQARNILVRQQYVAENAEGVNDFYSAVCKDLEDHELCEVRGVCINNKREVYSTAHQLAYDLSVELQREVTVVIIKGHAVTLYSPAAQPEKRKIILRTSYQEGQWTRREKAPRDHRGQIIKN